MVDPSQPTEFDAVARPMHYEGNGKITCMDAMRSMLAGYDRAAVDCEGAYWCTCAFKYLWRWPLKNNKEDLEKAKKCLEYAIDSLSDDWS